jgi:hypothetical protein
MGEKLMPEETVGPRAKWNDDEQAYVEKPRARYRAKRRRPDTQMKVAMLAAQNVSQRKIATEVGLDRGTVNALMKEDDMIAMVADLKRRIAQEVFPLIPESMKRHLERKEGDAFAALKIAESFGATVQRTDEGPRITINITRDRRTPPVQMGTIEAEVIKKEGEKDESV